MTDEVSLVAYADDLVIVIVAEDVRSAEQTLDAVIMIIRKWIKARGLKKAVYKTDLMVT